MIDYEIAKYLRISKDDATSDSMSIPHQRMLLDEFIDELDLPGFTVHEFEDNGYSGVNMNRPGVQEMLEMVRCGKINCIIVKDFSRFSRDSMESGYYIEQVFPLYGVRFISVSDHFDSKDYAGSTGGLDVAFKFLMHDYYSRDLSKKIKSAKHMQMRRGENIVSRAIYGYRKNDNGKWEHDPPAAEVVRQIFEMALDGKTTAQIRDNLNRITRIFSNTGQEKIHTYDAVGNVTSITDANGNTTKYSYSPNGNLLSAIDPLGNVTEYGYDKLGNMVEVKEFAELNEADELNRQNSKLRVTRYEWDEMGQVEKVTDPLGNIESYTYDESGNVISKLDKDGFLTKYVYNKANQIEEIAYADGNSVMLSYNPLRQLTEIKDWLGITSIEVDEAGRAKKVTDHNGNEIEYIFGSEGERRSIKYPDGKVSEYLYDDSLRLKTLIDGENKIDYLYDSHSRLSDKVFSNGVSTKYSYNEMGMLSELTHSDKDGVLDRYVYSYDKMVNKTGVEKFRRGLEEESGTYSFTYDALSRLTEVSKDGKQTKTFGYDSFGNRSAMSDGKSKTNYTYNALDRLISTADSMGAEHSYSYDGRGNLTQILENGKIKNSYEFNALNRLTKATNANGQTASYDYNGLGFRVGKQTADSLNPTRHINYVLDLTKQYNNMLQMSDGVDTQSYIWDSGVAFADGNAYLQDELGSPLRFVDNLGSTVESYGYGEFGDDLYGNQGLTQPFGYTGYTTDSISGTYFAQAREYIPQSGRFIGEDAIKSGSNWYAYCGSNPLSYIDPLGLDEFIPLVSEWNERARVTAEEWSHYHWLQGIRRRFTDVQLLTNRGITDLMPEMYAIATIFDLATGLYFNIVMARPGQRHSDWSPLTRADTEIIMQIVNPDLCPTSDLWSVSNTWPDFTPRNGILYLNGQYIAMGFHLMPHGSLIARDIANPELPRGTNRDGRSWFVGDHMCMYFKDSYGGTTRLFNTARETHELFN